MNLGAPSSVLARLVPPSRTLRVRLRAVDDVFLGAFAGGALHGALGHALARVAPGLERWMQPVTPAAGAPGFVAASPPAAVVVVPPGLGEVPDLRPGEGFECGFVLLGRASSEAARFVDAVAVMASEGLGDGRGRLEVVDVRDGAGVPVAMTASGSGGAPGDPSVGYDLRPEPVSHVSGRWAVATRTPLQLREEGSLVMQPTAAHVVRAAVRRLLALAWTFGTVPHDLDGRGLLDAARALAREEPEPALCGGEPRRARAGAADGPASRAAALRRVRLERYSSRQGRRHPLEGVMGTLPLDGIPDWALTALVAAQRFGIGKGPSLGLGHYELRLVA
jgi:hypothetical protein